MEERNNRVASLPAQSPLPRVKEICERILMCLFFFTSYISILSLVPRARQLAQDGLPLAPRLSRHGIIIARWVTAAAPNNQLTRRTNATSLHFPLQIYLLSSYKYPSTQSMSMAAPRPFAGPSYPISPTPTTPSVGYSQYGSQSFAGAPSRQLSMSSSAYAPSASVPSNRGPGMKTNEKKGESREVARVHWRVLKEFLSAWIERGAFSTKADPKMCSFFL